MPLAIGLSGVERTTDQNSTGVEFWSKFCSIAPPVMAANGADMLSSFRNAALSLLDRKAAHPLNDKHIEKSAQIRIWRGFSLPMRHLHKVGSTGFQPVQKPGEGRCSINDPQFSKTIFMKEYQGDIL